jgi:kynurenine formamidase
MKLIDLSVLVENSPSEPMTIKVKRLQHHSGAKKFCRNIAWNKRLPFKPRVKNLVKFLSGKKRIRASDFPDNAFLSLDIVTLPTHMGTHIDAPFHYGPSHYAQQGKTVDELSLEKFYQPGVRLDLRHKKPGEYIQIEDLKNALNAICHTIQANEIILIWTGSDELWGSPQYFSHAPGMSREATEWLVRQGVYVIGTDTYGFDRPFDAMLNDFWQTGEHKHLWPAHFYGREKEYVQIERLTNLGKLPDSGFTVICFPLKIKGIDASWVRAVALVDESNFAKLNK